MLCLKRIQTDLHFYVIYIFSLHWDMPWIHRSTTNWCDHSSNWLLISICRKHSFLWQWSRINALIDFGKLTLETIEYSIATSFRSTSTYTILYWKYGDVPYIFSVHFNPYVSDDYRDWMDYDQFMTVRPCTVILAVKRQQSALFLWIWNKTTLTLSSIWGHKYLVLMCLVLLKNANYMCCCIRHLKCVIDIT